MKYNKKKNLINWAIEENVSDKDFLKVIRKAEKGPFYTVEESMKRFEKWLEERNKTN